MIVRPKIEKKKINYCNRLSRHKLTLNAGWYNQYHCLGQIFVIVQCLYILLVGDLCFNPNKKQKPKNKRKLDTEKTYEKVIADIAAEYGKPYPWDVRVRIMGTVENVTAKIAVTELGLPITIDEFRQKFSKESRARLGHVPMMKGVHLWHRRFSCYRFVLCDFV